MSASVIMIAKLVINPNEKEALEHYVSGATLLFEAAGGEPVNRLTISKTLIGETSSLIALMKFPSEDAVTNVLDSEAYHRLIPFREKAFLKIELHLANAA